MKSSATYQTETPRAIREEHWQASGTHSCPLPTSHFSLCIFHLSLFICHFSFVTLHLSLCICHFAFVTLHFSLCISHFALVQHPPRRWVAGHQRSTTPLVACHAAGMPIGVSNSPPDARKYRHSLAVVLEWKIPLLRRLKVRRFESAPILFTFLQPTDTNFCSRTDPNNISSVFLTPWTKVKLCAHY